MKKFLYTAYFILLSVVLLAKVANWFLNFNYEIYHLISTTMFCLIGLGYIFMNHHTFTKKWPKVLTIICGSYIILMNFIERNTILTIIGIICIVTPLILARLMDNKRISKN
ncbi:MAG: hypothetical protein HWE21_12715 [Cytophagia bacterium]|nr:hypothetical protein [Cytophagia bacterium]